MKYGRRVAAMATAVSVVMMGLMMPRAASAQEGVIEIEESVIKGVRQKPEAFYILQNASLEYESLDAKPSFLDELVETVEEEPF